MNRKHYDGRRVAPMKKGGFWADYGYLLVTVAVVFVLFRVILQLAWVPSGSMETTIPTRSLLVSLRLPYLIGDPELERGDVVTFWSEELNKLLVKRVVGLPGEEISFVEGDVHIDGQELPEIYLPQQGQTRGRNGEVFSVPEGCYFMMGDNRTGSEDSRFWKEPYVSAGVVRAKVLLIISPFEESSWRGIRAVS